MNLLIRKPEEPEKNTKRKMRKFVSPGIHTIKKDKFHKNYYRKDKICKIYDIIIYKSGTITTSQ